MSHFRFVHDFHGNGGGQDGAVSELPSDEALVLAGPYLACIVHRDWSMVEAIAATILANPALVQTAQWGPWAPLWLRWSGGSLLPLPPQARPASLSREGQLQPSLLPDSLKVVDLSRVPPFSLHFACGGEDVSLCQKSTSPYV